MASRSRREARTRRRGPARSGRPRPPPHASALVPHRRRAALELRGATPAPPAPARAPARRLPLDDRVLARARHGRARAPFADRRWEAFCFGTRLTRVTRALPVRPGGARARRRRGARLGRRHADRRLAEGAPRPARPRRPRAAPSSCSAPTGSRSATRSCSRRRWSASAARAPPSGSTREGAPAYEPIGSDATAYPRTNRRRTDTTPGLSAHEPRDGLRPSYEDRSITGCHGVRGDAAPPYDKGPVSTVRLSKMRACLGTRERAGGLVGSVKPSATGMTSSWWRTRSRSSE